MALCATVRRGVAAALLCTPLLLNAAQPVRSMVVFGDSLSDTGNTARLLKSIRQEESPAYLVEPFKALVVGKMIDFAEEFYVPQIVLDAGVELVSQYFDLELGPYLASLLGKIKLVPIIPDQPYWNHRFSNGRVWNEYLAPMLNVERDDLNVYTNRAFGGSWAVTYDYQLTVWNLIRHPIELIKSLIVGKLVPPSLGLEVQSYLLAHPEINANTAYFFFSGANDYLNVLVFEDNYDTAVMSTYIDNVLSGIDESVHKMVKAGARHILVLGLPDVGITPKFVQTDDKEVLSEAIRTHNSRLQAMVAQWQNNEPDVDYLYIDVQAFLDRALAHPEIYRLTHTTEPCIDVKLPMITALNRSPFANNYVLRYQQTLHYKDQSLGADYKNYSVCGSPEGYLFWDDVHPTTRAHLHLAYEVCKAMNAQGYETACQLPANA